MTWESNRRQLEYQPRIHFLFLFPKWKINFLHLWSFFKSRRNIISLDIYFEDLSYEIIQQTPVYETWTIIGKSGSLENLANCHNCSELSYNYQLIFSILAIFLKGPRGGKRPNGKQFTTQLELSTATKEMRNDQVA